MVYVIIISYFNEVNLCYRGTHEPILHFLKGYFKSGVSIKAGYRRSTTACRTSYRRLFSPLGERGLTAPLVVTAAY